MTKSRYGAVQAVKVSVLWMAALSLSLLVGHTMGQQSREQMWKKVVEAEQKGLPQTALSALEPILETALREKDYPEAVRALVKKYHLIGTIEGNKAEEKIVRLQAEIGQVPAEMRPMLHAVLAHWYWQYYQQNRWRYLDRTATAVSPGEDIRTWDLPRIYMEIDKHFEAALQAEKELQAIPIARYGQWLKRGTLPDKYRPTLYDFLAFEAIHFYASGEQAGAKPQDAFEITPDMPIFDTLEDFLAWQPQTTDRNSPTYKAIRLFQKLLSFHWQDKDPTALLDADLHRLRFGWNHAAGPDKNRRYKAALERFITAQEKHELSALARYQLAEILHDEGDWAQAREIALQAQRSFPNSAGGQLAKALIQRIEAKEAQVNTERVWAEAGADILLTYRNLTETHICIVPDDFVGALQRHRWNPTHLEEHEIKALLEHQAARRFRHALPPTPDYKPRTEKIPAPKDLKPGFYRIIVGFDPDFRTWLGYTSVFVSNLAIVERQNQYTSVAEGLVVHAREGTPIAGAQVEAWRHGQQGGWFKVDAQAVTDPQGRYSLPLGVGNYILLVRHRDQFLASDPLWLGNGFNPGRVQQTVVFFTDRSIYRPGQTIHFKGIVLRTDPEADRYETLAGEPVTVVFRDVNGKEVDRLQLRSNDYGSFSGTFLAPQNRLTGAMTIRAERGGQGVAVVRVEEYKRPKFEVKLEVPQEGVRLQQAVSVQGTAQQYNGVPVAGGKVAYRVVRQVRYPRWLRDFCWWRPWRETPAQEIAHGVTTTGPDGRFTITFFARPDLQVDPADDPSFTYSITADVTDTTGETRTGTGSVQIGYVALRAEMSTPEWLPASQEVPLTLRTTTLDGQGQSARGTLTVYTLRQPPQPVRPPLDNPRERFPWRGLNGGQQQPSADPSQPYSWAEDKAVHTADFSTDAQGQFTARLRLAPGIYRAIVTTEDRFGKKVTAKHQFIVVEPEAARCAIRLPQVLMAPKWSCEVGEEFLLLWGSGYESAQAYVEIEHRGRILQSFWTDPQRTQQLIRQRIDEKMRGGFTVRVIFVRENRAYLTQRQVEVPWSNKQLQVKWERLVSRLEPGQKTIYTAIITGPDAQKAVAEVAAAMYDASLDAFYAHNWPRQIAPFRHDYSRYFLRFENGPTRFAFVRAPAPEVVNLEPLTYRSFPEEVTWDRHRHRFLREAGLDGGFIGRSGATRQALLAASPPEKLRADAPNAGLQAARGEADEGLVKGDPGAPPPPQSSSAALDQVSPRRNLQETAFFFPHLVSNAQGEVRIEFTAPEALTRWKVMLFAHDPQLRTGGVTAEVVTAKDLMVQPNPPRFLREGDVIEFTAKVSNLSTEAIAGQVRLQLFDARTLRPVDAELGNTQAEQKFELAAKESKSHAWRLTIPDGVGPLLYRVVAAGPRMSDGEEAHLPVLARRVLVRESLPLPIRNAGVKTFEFRKLLESGRSDTLRHQTLTVQMVSQPAWYAIMALPYLMEYPYECSEQVFNRLYANALARHIANSDPKIRRVFDQWKGTAALDSPLEKNADLKSVLLEETPWVREAVRESEARRQVGVLFDHDRLNRELAAALHKLAQMQHPDGAWPWFPGGPPNHYITLYITTGFGRLRHLGVKVDMEPALRAVVHLDHLAQRLYLEAQKHKPQENHLSPIVAFYLYGRSFFLADRAIAPEHQEAVNYWLDQARKYWLPLGHRQSQAHLALGLHRFGDKETARAILKSIREHAKVEEELGMYWRDQEMSHSWFRAPIETQALMIEAFDEVLGDAEAVENCKVWLLKMKQTTDWKTTKATADAVYALLLRGDNLLQSDALVEVTVGDYKIVPQKVEAGTGFYEHRFVQSDIKPDYGRITLRKTDAGVSWGSIHWSYLEDLSKVTPQTDTPLKLEKKLFRRTYGKSGPVLTPVEPGAALTVGDELVVRIILRTDRDMEYVHLKDYRGSGTEPVNVLSRYKWQDGLGYYESTRDTASHFFIEYLPKGVYVFEYALRVQHRGQYPMGYAQVQCMYAPEFQSHSETLTLRVE
ncbi:MAG: alpha-2-macroglobulin [Gemmataceae bacterium]|nr:MAG: alpha-2-macroglobulin [Gemmataceae bacterium]